MQSPNKDDKPFLLPGALFAKDGNYVITTVLGSCISVCMWDRTMKKGGMNHFKLPLWNGDGLPSPKFGNIAIEKLIENLLDIGCQQRNLIAKVFGGAAVIQNSSGLLNVGERNIEVARDYLSKARVPIAASDVGGTQSRKVIFNTVDGSILMKKAAPQ